VTAHTSPKKELARFNVFTTNYEVLQLTSSGSIDCEKDGEKKTQVFSLTWQKLRIQNSAIYLNINVSPYPDKQAAALRFQPKLNPLCKIYF